MTVGQFIKRARGCDDYELVIRKHDKHQLTCHTTVSVQDANAGFDWTHGKFVIEPSVELSTSQAVVDKHIREQLRNYSSRVTEHMSLAAQIAKLILDIKDVELRDKIHTILKKF